MHPLMKYISWLLLLYVAYCGLLYFFQRQILFPRPTVVCFIFFSDRFCFPAT
jgi:hypothetical protein